MLKTRMEILKVIKIIMNLRIEKKKGKCNFSSMHRGVNGDSSHQFNNEAPALCLTLALPQSQGSLRAVLAISLAFRLPASPHPARAVRPVPGPVRRLALLVGMGCQRNKKGGGEKKKKKETRRKEGRRKGGKRLPFYIHSRIR